MLRKIIMLLLLLFTINGSAQEDAWVYLKDKLNVSDALANPNTILSQKAIDRKQRHNISIDEKDVPVNESYISELKNQTGILVLAKSKWFNAVHVRGTETNIKALVALDFVDYVNFANRSLNSRSQFSEIQDKSDLENQRTSFNYGDAQNQVQMISADKLHLDEFTGSGITIAVMDSGFFNVNIMGAFERLRSNGNLLDGYDFVNRNSNVYENISSSHGTRVLSTMAGFVQDQFVGTAPDASYYLFLTEDVGSENPVEESYWVEAAERADSLGVDMINTSLGYREYDNSNYDYSPSEMNGQVAFISKGASLAVEKGILVVVSAGNAGAIDWRTVGAPADSPDVLSIGGVDANGNYVAFSSQGSDAQVGFQKPDVVARAGSAFVINETNSIVQNNGTSFSGPIICGGIASLWQAIPDASPKEVMDYVRQSASQFASPDDFLGYGIPDLDESRRIALLVKETQNKEFKIYPNPMTTNLNIQIPLDLNKVEVSIFNQIGQVVFKSLISNGLKTFNVSHLSKGLYLIKISDESTSEAFKIIKE